MVYMTCMGLFLMFSFITKKSETKRLFFISFVCITLFAVFRFGLGTDYFTYYLFYDVCPARRISDLNFRNYILSQQEPGYYICEFIFKYLKLPYEVFVAFCALFSLFFTYKAISLLSKNILLSFFVFFANYYLVEVQNIVRQGMAMAIFLYALSEWILCRNNKKYFLWIIFASSFHFSVILCFFVPLINKLPTKWFYNYINIIIFSSVSLVVGLFLPKMLIMIVSKVFPRYAAYKMSGFNILATGLRLVELILVLLLRDKAKYDSCDSILYKIFLFGLYLSFVCMTMDVLTRLTEHFLFIEVLLIPNLLCRISKNRRSIYLPIFLVLYSFLFMKDIASFSKQGEFISCKKFYEYPYVSVFNKEKIKDIRPSNSYERYFSNSSK